MAGRREKAEDEVDLAAPERNHLPGPESRESVVAVLASGFLARQIALDNFRPLGPFTAGSHGAAIVEHLIGSALSLMLGLAAGIAVRRLEQARGWDLAPFFRGAVVGSFVAVPIVLAVLDQNSLTNPNSGHRLTALGLIAAGFAIGLIRPQNHAPRPHFRARRRVCLPKWRHWGG
jgi:uncharacterized membrane protein YidH (DUF202 family)